MLSNDINDYHIVAQGKTSIPGVDDGEEMRLTDVSRFETTASYHSLSFFHSVLQLSMLRAYAWGQVAWPRPNAYVRTTTCSVFRNDNAYLSMLWLSLDKSRADANTWSQRRRRVVASLRKFATCTEQASTFGHLHFSLPAKFLTYLRGRQLAPCRSSKGGFLHRCWSFCHVLVLKPQNHHPAQKHIYYKQIN